MKSLLATATLIGACSLCAPAQEAKPGAQVAPEAKQSMVSSGLGELIDIPVSEDSAVGFNASFSYSTGGGKVNMYPHVVLGFDTQALKNLRPRGSDIISIVVDEMPIAINSYSDDLDHRDDIAVGRIDHDGGWVEVAIPRSEFAKLVKAKGVRIQLGSLAFSLSDDHLKSLRGLASRMSEVEKRSVK